jgi:hypothetical protein
MYAALQPTPAMVELLLSHGAEAGARTKEHWDAREIAYQHGNLENAVFFDRRERDGETAKQ